MSLKLNLAIPNKAVHAFIGLIVLTVIASGVYAYIVLPGSTPNPGHALSTIQGFFQGDASLLDSLGKVQQEVSGACPGQVIVGINADGTVSCEADDTGIDDRLYQAILAGYQKTVCTGGTAAQCTGANESWTGSSCCITANYPVCTGGTAAQCTGTNESWTGSSCCVAGYPVCTGGTAVQCTGANESWTGSSCCVGGYPVCTGGTAVQCTGTNESWTGSACCVTDVTSCTGGTAAQCTGAGEYWTGSSCCV